MAKPGKGIYKIGPWICESDKPTIAKALLCKVMYKIPKSKLWVGVPEDNKASVAILKANRFESLKPCLRMYYGRYLPMGDPKGVFGIAASKKG